MSDNIMICHHKKCIFVHIPKTAGQSIDHVFLSLLDLNWETRAPLLLRYNDRPELGPPRLAHLKAGEYVRYRYLSQELFDEYFKFSFVRNPWDRLVSIYRSLGFHWRYEFKYFVMKKLKDRIWQEKYWFVGPQSEFVCAEDGTILVDFIGRFENLQIDFSRVCQRIGLPSTELLHVNKSHELTGPSLILRPRYFMKYTKSLLTGKPAPVFRKYQDYYDSESRGFIAELYKSDIELLGYEFDESDLPT